ncbi:hypothetical protein CKO24_11440 [Rhodothalassium salexigens DSM 2132]|nr:hypothetical protein [Rhodothalassium salexigens DSM 2132]
MPARPTSAGDWRPRASPSTAATGSTGRAIAGPGPAMCGSSPAAWRPTAEPYAACGIAARAAPALIRGAPASRTRAMTQTSERSDPTGADAQGATAEAKDGPGAAPGLTTFYNEACPVCSAEINHYRDEADAAGAPLAWVDISTEGADLARHGVTQEMAYRRLYAVDEHDTLLVGLDAFIAIWRRLPKRRWHLLADAVSLPGVNPVMSWGYEHVAARAIYGWNKRRLAREARERRRPSGRTGLARRRAARVTGDGPGDG